MAPQHINISNPDGSKNRLTIYEGNRSAGSNVLIICPAMGVRGKYYTPLAEHFAAQGQIAIITDLRGLGESSVRPTRGKNFGYREMLEWDYQSIIDFVQERYPDGQIFLLGHSLGGQLASLFAAKRPDSISGLILVACCSVYYKGWDGMRSYQVLLGTQSARLLASLLGYFPGDKLGFGGLAAQRVISDWARQAQSGQYRPAGDDFDYEQGLRAMEIPVLAISFEGDNLAPAKAVRNLYQKFKHPEQVLHRHLGKESGLNHFNWAKKPEDVVQEVLTWLEGGA